MEIENIDDERDIFKNYIDRRHYNIILNYNKVNNIKKNEISIYFNEICIHDKSKTNFNFIFDNNRLELMNKIDKFFDSQNKFYWILGSDGIGKTVTFLVYSSLLKKFRKLYLNLKLFYKTEIDRVENIFFNEIKRLFLTNNNNLDLYYDYYLKIIYLLKEKSKVVLQQLKDKDYIWINIYNKGGIIYFWILLFIFLEIYDSLKIKDFLFDLLVIIDQYKSAEIDPQYINLNKLLLKVNDIKNYKMKILIACSINNYDNKDLFLENLYSISLNNEDSNNNTAPIPLLKNNFKENINSSKNLEEEQYFIEDKELINIEKYLDSIIEFNKKLFDTYSIKNSNKKNISFSKCYLNSQYSQITIKEYYNNFVSCKNIIDPKLGKNYRHCIKVFNDSLKYYELLLKEIKETKKNTNNQEKEEEFEARVLKSFYLKNLGKIEDKIKEFYLSKFNANKNTNIIFNQYYVDQLVELRESIYEEKIYSLGQISNLLKNYPTKYLNIYITGLNKNLIKIDDADLYNKFTFYFDYSNSFVRTAINQIINKESLNYRNITLEGSGFGAELEVRVNKTLETIFSDNISKRNIFSLIGTTKNTKNYIEEMRKKENNFFYEFYDLKRLNILIDGIDKSPITSDIFDIRNKNIYLHQVSETAKSFDNGLLYKIDDGDGDEDYTHDLVNVQTTKAKPIQCKSKEEYTNDCLKSRKYLEKIYKGLKIRRIYFIFILPYKYVGLEKTIKELKKQNIYYIYYSTYKNIFCDEIGNRITDLKIKEAEIEISDLDFHYQNALSNYYKSKIILNKAIKNYLSINRLNNNNLIKSYIKLNESLSYDTVKIIIPDELKENIFLQLCEKLYFKKNNHLNFIFTTNYKGSKIPALFQKTLSLIIFSYNNKILFYYGDYYEIKDDYSIEELPNIFLKEITKIKKPKYNIIDLFEIKKYPLFCFCFRIINDFVFDD